MERGTHPVFSGKSKDGSSEFAVLGPLEYRELRARTFDEFFPRLESPGALTSSTPIVSQLDFEREALDAFHQSFERLLRHRRGLQGLARSRDFVKWWETHRGALLTRPVVETYRQAGMTLGEFLDETHLRFITEHHQAQEKGWVLQKARKFGKHPLLIGLLLTVTPLVERGFNFIWNLMVLGPGVQMINSYTQPVITPLSQTASQKGSQDLAGFASWVQSWLSSGSRVKAVKKQLADTTADLQKYDFSGMSRADAEQTWRKFEQTYFKLFLSFNQMLPSHLRDGRSFYKDWMMLAPINLASNLAVFDTQYWIHKREAEAVKAVPSAKRSASHRQSLRVHEEAMAAAESRIAATLAAWKLYEFMYPEFAREPANGSSRDQLHQAYKSFAKSLRFDVYIQQFAAKMQDILKHMDLEFAVQDYLARDRLPAGAKKPGEEAGV